MKMFRMISGRSLAEALGITAEDAAPTTKPDMPEKKPGISISDLMRDD